MQTYSHFLGNAKGFYIGGGPYNYASGFKGNIKVSIDILIDTHPYIHLRTHTDTHNDLHSHKQFYLNIIITLLQE